MKQNPWLYEAEEKHNAKYAPNLALPSCEEQSANSRLAITGTANKESDTRPTQVENWRFQNFNSVMYPPDGTFLFDLIYIFSYTNSKN